MPIFQFCPVVFFVILYFFFCAQQFRFWYMDLGFMFIIEVEIFRI
jgi:hypothetical protein